MLILLNLESPEPRNSGQSEDGSLGENLSATGANAGEETPTAWSAGSSSRDANRSVFVSNQQSKPTAGDEKRTQTARETLSHFMKRDEQELTFEVLADGTELIHANGTNGHFSAASIGPDGDVVVNCHGSLAGLENQGQVDLDPNQEEHVR